MSFKADIPTLSANEVYTLTFEYEGTETIQLIVGDLTLETTDRRVVFTTTSPVNYIESNVNLTNLNMYEGYYESDDFGGEYTQESYIEGKSLVDISSRLQPYHTSDTWNESQGSCVILNDGWRKMTAGTVAYNHYRYGVPAKDVFVEGKEYTIGVFVRNNNCTTGKFYLDIGHSSHTVKSTETEDFKVYLLKITNQNFTGGTLTFNNATNGDNFEFMVTILEGDRYDDMVNGLILPFKDIGCVKSPKIVSRNEDGTEESIITTPDYLELYELDGIFDKLDLTNGIVTKYIGNNNGSLYLLDTPITEQISLNPLKSYRNGSIQTSSQQLAPTLKTTLPISNKFTTTNLTSGSTYNVYFDGTATKLDAGGTIITNPISPCEVECGSTTLMIEGTDIQNIRVIETTVKNEVGNNGISDVELSKIETSDVNGENIITSDLEQPIKLRSLGTTYDSYNLVTGELTKRIGVSETDGSYSVLSSPIISKVEINNIPRVYKNGIIKIYSDSNIYPITTLEILTTNKYDISTWETGVYTQRNIVEIYFNDSTTPMIPTETLTLTENHLLNGHMIIIGENPMLIKGNYTGRDIPYFTGMRSVEAIEVETTNSDSSIQSTIQLPPHIQLHSLPNGTCDELDIKAGILIRRTQKVNNEIIALETPTTEQLILNYNNSCDYGRILPTGMCDKYDVVNSMYTQTMISILLDGENAWDAMEEMTNVIKFTATGATVGVDNLNMLGNGGLYCDNDLFPNINDDSDVEHCRVDVEGNKFYIYVNKDRLMSPDLIGWQIWLQSNSFNLIYELAEHLIYKKPYEELDATQARWQGMDCMRDGSIKYYTNNADNITIYPTLEYVAPSINNFELTMLEPNTEYTIYAEGINQGDTVSFGGTDIKFNNGTVFTSGNDQWLRIDNNDSFYNMVVTKGDTTGEVVPYFEGMTSVENPKVQCKNSTVSYTDLKLRSLPNGVKDMINVVTGEYVQRIGERDYQDGDLTNENVLTDGINTVYELTKPITTKLDPQTLLMYKDGTLNLSSNTGLLPTTHYTVPSTNTYNLSSMKTGTRYTLKYPSASGSIKIGDITYAISSSSMLFTTPLKINGDKSAIVFTDENPQDVILIEGAYNTREIPYFTGLKSVKNPIITITDNTTGKSVDYKCTTDIELRGLPNGVSDSLDIVKGTLTTVVGYRPYQNGDEDLSNVWTDGYNTAYALPNPIVSKVEFTTPTLTTNSSINLSSDNLIPQLNYKALSSNNFPLDLLTSNTTYTLYAEVLVGGSYTLGGTYKGTFTGGSQVITLNSITDNLLTFNGDLGLSNVMLVKGNTTKSTVPHFTGIQSVTNAEFLIEGYAGETNEVAMDSDIVLRNCEGVKDEIDLSTCILTKRTGEIVLTGKENWYKEESESINGYNVFKLTLTGIAQKALMCDRFNYVLNGVNQDCIYSYNNQLCLRVAGTTINGDTLDALKLWLNQNNTTVVYVLNSYIEIPLTNVWTTMPPTSYSNRTTISSTSVNSLKPMFSVTIATTTLEQIVSSLENENIATMLALTSMYEAFMVSATSEDENEMSLSDGKDGSNVEGMTVSPIGMVYVKLIKKGLKTIEQVPSTLKAEVKYALKG